MLPAKRYNPSTETSRRPTPTTFAHLRSWIEELKRSQKITSIEQLANINEQLRVNAELYISNIIQRVIAQLIGKYGDGFVTIEATADGRLKVDAGVPASAQLQAAINFATAITSEIVAAVSGKKIKVANIMLTVAGETNLTFKSDSDSISGPLDFGGTDEPRGMVHSLSDYPLETAEGEAFGLASSLAVQVSGYVTYYTE